MRAITTTFPNNGDYFAFVFGSHELRYTRTSSTSASITFNGDARGTIALTAGVSGGAMGINTPAFVIFGTDQYSDFLDNIGGTGGPALIEFNLIEQIIDDATADGVYSIKGTSGVTVDDLTWTRDIRSCLGEPFDACEFDFWEAIDAYPQGVPPDATVSISGFEDFDYEDFFMVTHTCTMTGWNTDFNLTNSTQGCTDYSYSGTRPGGTGLNASLIITAEIRRFHRDDATAVSLHYVYVRITGWDVYGSGYVDGDFVSDIETADVLAAAIWGSTPITLWPMETSFPPTYPTTTDPTHTNLNQDELNTKTDCDDTWGPGSANGPISITITFTP